MKWIVSMCKALSVLVFAHSLCQPASAHKLDYFKIVDGFPPLLHQGQRYWIEVEVGSFLYNTRDLYFPGRFFSPSGFIKYTNLYLDAKHKQCRYDEDLVLICNYWVPLDAFTLSSGAELYFFPLNIDTDYRYHSIVQVVPSEIQLLSLGTVNAKANTKLELDLSAMIAYKAIWKREEVNFRYRISPDPKPYGLQLNASTGLLQGVMNQVGELNFKVFVDGQGLAVKERILHLQVHSDPKALPQFSQASSPIIVAPNQNLTVPLKSLIENTERFTEADALRFHLLANDDPISQHIQIQDNCLSGQSIPVQLAGQQHQILIEACTNSGGCTLPFQIPIEVLPDSSMQPKFPEPIRIDAEAGRLMEFDLSKYIVNPSQDNSLQLIMDSIEPKVDWIKQSPGRSTLLEMSIPNDVVGQSFLLQVHANTQSGGDSSPQLVQLQIQNNPEQIPKFKPGRPRIPPISAGTSLVYDFQQQQDISPEFDDIPYWIEWDSEYPQPSWLEIKDNRLYIHQFPEQHADEARPLCLKIGNVPGGTSERYCFDIALKSDIFPKYGQSVE